MTDMTTNRIEYAAKNKELYIRFVEAVAAHPSSPQRRIEWAILTANAPFERSVRAWGNIEGVEAGDVASGIRAAGLMQYNSKAEYINKLRERMDVPIPTTAPVNGGYRAIRSQAVNSIPGLGLSKWSFAACLVNPIHSDVACLDTHMIQEYLGYVPNGSWYRNKKQYETVESLLIREANSLSMPVFSYQWAVWDYRRGAVEPHTHLTGIELHDIVDTSVWKGE